MLALSLPSTTISSATDVPAGAFNAPDGTVLDALPAFCRLVGVSRPASDSEIEFEVWIPSAGWNQNYLQVGTVVFAGNIQYRSLGFALRRGYATATTDGGHRASIGDASFALGHPQKIVDWGYQALATTISNGKALVSAYTHRAPRHAYFFGASNSGRDALIAAQRFPDAFDGIIVDAPSSTWVHNAFSWLWSQDATPGTWDQWVTGNAAVPGGGHAVLANQGSLKIQVQHVI